MPKMLKDFTNIRDAIYADIDEDARSANLISAWEEREGIDARDWDGSLNEMVIQCAENSPGLRVALMVDPIDFKAFAMLMFIMGWELQKKKAFEEQFDATS